MVTMGSFSKDNRNRYDQSLGDLILKNPFDSHVHWEATGAFHHELNLSALKSPSDIKSLAVKPEHKRQDWILGYHWDDSAWNEKPNRKHLDEWYRDQPVVLMRVDRHAAWVNTKALELANLLHKRETPFIPGGEIEIDKDGVPTGLLKDQAMTAVKNKIPEKTLSQVLENLAKGTQIFHQAGFTHIRDMTCNSLQIEAMQILSSKNELRLAIEQYFDVHSPMQLKETFRLIRQYKASIGSKVRIKGIKLFYDGALGSEGAWISRPYYGCGSNKGFTLYEKPVLSQMISDIWAENLEVAIHAIGDQAAHDVLQIAVQVSSKGKGGILHIEHAQMLRPETIQMMKGLNITCHFQPCHWLSDKRWTEKKLGPLAKYLFRWKELECVGIPFYFGSDAPIEPSSLIRTYQALVDANESGIPFVESDWKKYVQHPDDQWIKNCRCEIKNGLVHKTIFDDQTVRYS